MENQPFVLDVSTRLFYLKETWVGLTYRDNGTFIFSSGFGSGNVHFSYSYDHTFTGEIQQYTYGTHEIGIAFRFETLANQRHINFWGH